MFRPSLLPTGHLESTSQKINPILQLTFWFSDISSSSVRTDATMFSICWLAKRVVCDVSGLLKGRDDEYSS